MQEFEGPKLTQSVKWTLDRLFLCSLYWQFPVKIVLQYWSEDSAVRGTADTAALTPLLQVWARGGHLAAAGQHEARAVILRHTERRRGPHCHRWLGREYTLVLTIKHSMSNANYDGIYFTKWPDNKICWPCFASSWALENRLKINAMEHFEIRFLLRILIWILNERMSVFYFAVWDQNIFDVASMYLSLSLWIKQEMSYCQVQEWSQSLESGFINIIHRIESCFYLHK